jgi:hypothetical protein
MNQPFDTGLKPFSQTGKMSPSFASAPKRDCKINNLLTFRIAKNSLLIISITAK